MAKDDVAWKFSPQRNCLIIFDCDGVLVDSEELFIEIDRLVLAELGWPIERDEIVARFVGRSEEHFVNEVQAFLGQKLPADWMGSFQRHYQEVFRRDLRPVAGISETLDAIDVPTCVASNGSHEKMRFTLGLTGLWPYFEGRTFSASDVSRAKPAPDLFLHAASTLGFAPEDCTVVEDSLAGVQAALSAGMKVVAYAGGVVTREKFAGTGATIIDEMSQLPRTLQRLVE